MATTPNYGWETPDDTDLISASAAILRNTFDDIDEQIFTAIKPYHNYYPTSGSWFGLNYFFNNGDANTATNEDVRQNEMFANLFAINENVTLDRLAINVSVAGTNTTYRLGIYNADTSGNPSTLRLDAGTVLGTTTGVKELTISHALPKGVYYLVVARQNTSIGTVQRLLGQNQSWSEFKATVASWFPNYTQTFNVNATVDLTPVKSGTAVSGALPASFGTVVTSTEDPIVIARLA